MGAMPLAGDFRASGERNELYPLAVDFCGRCGLPQVRETVDLSLLFNPTYSFASSTVPGLVRHFAAYAESVALPPGSRRRKLLEIGCNDGVFLERLRELGYDVVGVDASDNVAALARGKGLDVHTGFFDEGLAESLLAGYGPFDVITCSNVFAHIPDVNGFLSGVTRILATGGGFWVEVHSAHRLLEGLQWDCFYHEHCFYWTIHSLQRALQRHGLGLRAYETTPMHGGALRAVFSRQGPLVPPVEREPTIDDWRRFGAACRRSRALVRTAISELPISYAYGAAGRAVTLINWTGIADRLRFVVDASPLRYGKVIPNTSVPVIPETEFLARPSGGDWCFVTAHNYLDDIRRKVEAALPERFIKFVTPLPHVSIH